MKDLPWSARRTTMMSELNPQPLPPGLLPPGDRIRISAPAAVLNDLELFQRAQASVLRQAGCPRCHSGLQLLWQAFTDYAVNEEGEARPAAPGSAAAD
jgi:hypothetical protein